MVSSSFSHDERSVRSSSESQSKHSEFFVGSQSVFWSIAIFAFKVRRAPNETPFHQQPNMRAMERVE